jgi:hypothetical protein
MAGGKQMIKNKTFRWLVYPAVFAPDTLRLMLQYDTAEWVNREHNRRAEEEKSK